MYKDLLKDISLILGNTESAIAICYLYALYQICDNNNPFSITIKEISKHEKDEKIRFALSEYLDEESWVKAKELLKKYNKEDIEEAIINIGENFELFRNDETPKCICNLAEGILDIKIHDSVADICSGKGNFILSETNVSNNSFAFEIDTKNIIISKIKSTILNRTIKIEQGDVFGLYGTDQLKDEEYDKVFAHYPFGLRIDITSKNIKLFEEMKKDIDSIKKNTSSNWMFNYLLTKVIKKDGKALCISNNGILWNGMDEPVRKYFVDNGLIESIIALPERLFNNTNIPTTIVVFSNNNKTIKMVDARDIYHHGRRTNTLNETDIELILKRIKSNSDSSKNISIKTISSNGYILEPGRYLIQIDELKNGVKFEDVINIIQRGAPLKASELDDMESNKKTEYQYLRLANINNGDIDEDLPYIKSVDDKYEKYLLKDNMLILSKNGAPFKSAVANIKNNQKIVANGNLYAIELDEKKVNPRFLQAYFSSEKGMDRLKSITVGAAIPTISIKDLKKLEIPLPDMRKQNRIAEQYQDTLDEIRVLKTKLNRAINKLNSVFDCKEEG